MPATMKNESLIIQAGIDPKTGLPARAVLDCKLKEDVRKLIRIRDEQDAVNRYVWYNLPCNLSSQELERLLYYKGQLCFFYFEELEEFYFMPYALDGTIDFYGRFNTVHPVPMTSGTEKNAEKLNRMQAELLSQKRLNVLYDIPYKGVTVDDIINGCVIISDYTNQLSQTLLPRQQLQEGIIDIESECIPMMRTALRNSTGVSGMRVGDQSEQGNVTEANRLIDEAVLNGKRYIAVTGKIDFQDLAFGTVGKAEEFAMAHQTLDNLRLSMYGIQNGGIYDKKSYVNKDQTALNDSNVDSPLIDGLAIRQRFCDIANGIWGIGMSCELRESVINTDRNRDGLMYNNQDQSGIPGEQEAKNG